jgi:predicted nuclease with TOPRIM domain
MSSGDTLKEILTMVNSIGAGVTNLGLRMEAVETRLDKLETRFDKVESGLDALNTKVDERLQDTRPLWEGVNARLDSIDRGLRSLNRHFDQLAGEMVRLHGWHGDLEERVNKLEEKAS